MTLVKPSVPQTLQGEPGRRSTCQSYDVSLILAKTLVQART